MVSRKRQKDPTMPFLESCSYNPTTDIRPRSAHLSPPLGPRLRRPGPDLLHVGVPVHPVQPNREKLGQDGRRHLPAGRHHDRHRVLCLVVLGLPGSVPRRLPRALCHAPQHAVAHASRRHGRPRSRRSRQYYPGLQAKHHGRLVQVHGRGPDLYVSFPPLVPPQISH